jgi:hypothetical protein
MASTRTAPLALADVRALREAAQRFGPAARVAKTELLAALRERGLDRPRVLAEYHDALLFLAAYADDDGVAALADAELARVARTARKLAARGASTPGSSGMAWCSISAALSYDIARWLDERFPGRVELTSFGDGGAQLADVLALALPAMEADSLALDDEPIALLDRLKGRAATRLRFLLMHLARMRVPAAVRGHLYESLTPFVTIEPRDTPASRTFLRGPPAPVHRQDVPLVRSLPAPRAVIERPLPAARTSSAGERAALVDTARATLAMLARETDPLTWPSVDAVSLHELEGGWSVALYPMDPERRFALDSHTGYLLFRNRVPVAYGGGWPFLGVCRTGINVFAAFRGGESALAFAQVLRVYRARYGCARFVVEPYQFGAGNAEGLRSGAFWFYWRLGFRPVEARLRGIAAREFARLGRDRGARTPLPLMRKLTGADLALDLAPLPAEQRVEAGNLAFAVSAWIARVHGGDREAAQRDSFERVRTALDVRDDERWPDGERAAFRSLSLVVGQIDGLAQWSAPDKAACVALMRAKGAADDRPYFLGLAAHPRLPSSLMRIARGRARA